MLRPVQSLNYYKYELSDMIITKKGSSTPIILLASNVKSIVILNKYINNIIPIVQITANVEKELYKLLTLSETELSVQLILYKYIDNSEIRAKELFINKQFALLNEYDLQPNEMSMFDFEKNEPDNTITNVHTEQTVAASFYLIDKSNLEKYRKVKSYAVSNASIVDVIAMSFSDRGFTSLLMNTIPNPHVGTIIIPAYNLLASLDYLNYRYGLFNTDYIFYMDINDNYLLDRINLGKAVKEGTPSTANLYLERNSTVEIGEIGNVLQGNSYIANLTTAHVNKLDGYAEYLAGSIIISVDVNDTIQRIGSEGMERTMYVFNHKVSQQASHRAKEFRKSLTVNLQEIDLNMISPAILYNIIADSNFQSINPISGLYRLNESTIVLSKASDNKFHNKVSLVLMKIIN